MLLYLTPSGGLKLVVVFSGVLFAPHAVYLTPSGGLKHNIAFAHQSTAAFLPYPLWGIETYYCQSKGHIRDNLPYPIWGIETQWVPLFCAVFSYAYLTPYGKIPFHNYCFFTDDKSVARWAEYATNATLLLWNN